MEHILTSDPAIRIVECNGQVVLKETLGPYCNLQNPSSNCPCPGNLEKCLSPNPDPLCAFVQHGCEEALEAKDLEVYQVVGEKVPPGFILGSADLYWPVYHEVTIRFLAEYGSFESQIYGSGKAGPSSKYYGKYIPPIPSHMPADGYDTAWVVIIDRTAKTYVESEKVTFNIEEPENVHEVHPVG